MPHTMCNERGIDKTSTRCDITSAFSRVLPRTGAADHMIGPVPQIYSTLLYQVFLTCVLLPQDLLIELSDAGFGNLVDKHHSIGQSHASYLGTEMFEDVFLAQCRARPGDNQGERPLAPFFVRYSNDRRFQDILVPHDLALEFDARDPFAAASDEVLGTIDDLNV